MAIEGFEGYRPEDAKLYTERRWWQGMTWGDMFDKGSDLYPRKEILVDDTSRLTYRELREKIDRLAISFIELGIKPRDFVLLQIPNWHEFVIAFYACHKAGAIAVLLVARHGIAEIDFLSSLTHPVGVDRPGPVQEDGLCAHAEDSSTNPYRAQAPHLGALAGK